MGNNELSTGIAKGYCVNDSIFDVENRESGLGQTAQASLDIIFIETPPIHNLNSINGNSSCEFHLQPGSAIICVREGSRVVINGIIRRKLVPESGRLSDSSSCSFVVPPRKGSEVKDLDVLAVGGIQTNFFGSRAGLYIMMKRKELVRIGFMYAMKKEMKYRQGKSTYASLKVENWISVSASIAKT
jgi:hypothetical protein